MGLRVAHLERSLAFYAALGYQVIGSVPATSFGDLTMLKLPDDPFVAIELVSRSSASFSISAGGASGSNSNRRAPPSIAYDETSGPHHCRSFHSGCRASQCQTPLRTSRTARCYATEAAESNPRKVPVELLTSGLGGRVDLLSARSPSSRVRARSPIAVLSTIYAWRRECAPADASAGRSVTACAVTPCTSGAATARIAERSLGARSPCTGSGPSRRLR